MDDKQLQKLIRKNVEKVEKAQKNKQQRTYDNTLPNRQTTDDDLERQEFFDEMKRREF